MMDNISSLKISERSPVQPKTSEQKKLWDVAVEFEAIFIKQMLDSMKKTVNKTKLIDGGMTEEIFDDMLCEQRSVSMAKNGSMGLAKTIYNQLSQIQSFKDSSKL